jgi:hypothetical protein
MNDDRADTSFDSFVGGVNTSTVVESNIFPHQLFYSIVSTVDRDLYQGEVEYYMERGAPEQ